MEDASKVRIVPQKGRGKGEIIPLDKKIVSYWTCASGKNLMTRLLDPALRLTPSPIKEIPTFSRVSRPNRARSPD